MTVTPEAVLQEELLRLMASWIMKQEVDKAEPDMRFVTAIGLVLTDLANQKLPV